jgi:cation transport ATPase
MNNSSSNDNAVAIKLRVWENMHIVFWLVKDMCWVSDFHTLGVAMIFPTITVALWMVYQSWRNRTELIHNVAVLCWIAANSIWMIGEFFFQNSTKFLAQCFFGVGILVLALHYVPRLSVIIKTRNTNR